ncbi:MAG: hypothetical protein WCF23_19235 [Candidatus Nitrosopolaris sp.]
MIANYDTFEIFGVERGFYRLKTNKLTLRRKFVNSSYTFRPTIIITIKVKPRRGIDILCDDKKINRQKVYFNCDKLAPYQEAFGDIDMNTLAMKGKIQHLKNHIAELRQLSNSLNHDIDELPKELRILEMSEDNNTNIMSEENEDEE